MHCHFSPHAFSWVRSAGVALFASFVGIAAAFADTATVTVASNPTTASLSRTNGAEYFVEYSITVTNQSARNAAIYDFKGKTSVTDGVNPVPTSTTTAIYKSSIGVTCTPTSLDVTVIQCTSVKIGANSSKTFKVTFKTPTAGTNLRFVLTATSGAYKGGEGYADTTLVTAPLSDITTGFTTYVPVGGGTFYTGYNGNGGVTSPGGVATATDPFTTTIVVPNISFSTTATVAEATVPSSCLSAYSQCYESNLTIPGTFSHLTVYLRIDASKIAISANIANVAIYYAHVSGSTPVLVPNCVDVGGAPSPGQPCVESKQRYISTTAPNSEWIGDFEFKIQALDNGRYIN